MVRPAGKKPAPGFRLRDEHGHSLSLKGERGRVVLLTFMYSRCREICPIGRMLAAAERRVGRSIRAVLLVVRVDPGGDRPATIRRFIRGAGLAGSRWHWLAGSRWHWLAGSRWHWLAGSRWHWLVSKRSQLAPVWRAYRIEVRAGRTIYAVPVQPRLVAEDVRTLARETG